MHELYRAGKIRAVGVSNFSAAEMRDAHAVLARYRLDHNPGDVNTRVNLGITLIEDGRLGEAIVEIEQALRIKPDSVPALNALGRALLADGRVEPARAAFERAIAIHPEDPVAHLGLARAHLARGDRTAAREQIPILDRFDPQLARMLEQEIR